jgi:hypothetical protein
MAIITTYPLATPVKTDYIVGSKLTTVGSQINPTKNFTVESVVSVVLSSLPKYDDNTSALAAGLSSGQQYQTTGSGAAPLNVAGIVMIVQ